ncbi:MAG TPA: universal stress protein [Cyclobacteriaceae bacterium]|nr:universal stress protein [Cyclobacteriaceae bacterium]
MKGKILCPIDFSESSIEALKYAIEMANKEGRSVTVLYSYRLIQPDQEEEILKFRNRVELRARERFCMLEPFFHNGTITDHEFLIEIGFFGDCILRQIRTNSVDKIVIDKNMRRLITERPQDAFLGSLPVPVVIVGDDSPSP